MPPMRAPPTHSRPPPDAHATAPAPPFSRRARRRPYSSLATPCPSPRQPRPASAARRGIGRDEREEEMGGGRKEAVRGAHRRDGVCRRLAGGGVTRQRRRVCGTFPGGASRSVKVHGRRRRCGEMGFGWPRSGCNGSWRCWWLGGADVDVNFYFMYNNNLYQRSLYLAPPCPSSPPCIWRRRTTTMLAPPPPVEDDRETVMARQKPRCFGHIRLSELMIMLLY